MYVMSLGMDFEVGLGLVMIYIWMVSFSHTEDYGLEKFLDFEFHSFAVTVTFVFHRTLNTVLSVDFVFDKLLKLYTGMYNGKWHYTCCKHLYML